MNRGMDDSEWPQLPILESTDWFIPRRIWCIGRNYRAHALEMGDTGNKPPLVFSKHPMALIPADAEGRCTLAYPRQCESLHHEVELVLAIGAHGKMIGSAVGLDMTRRALQRRLKDRRGPWTLAKDFEGAAPIGPIRLGMPLQSGPITLAVNGEIRQSGDVSQMLWGSEELLKYVEQYDRLAAGDLIFTGTPSGVDAVSIGDVLSAQILGYPTLEVTIVDPDDAV